MIDAAFIGHIRSGLDDTCTLRHLYVCVRNHNQWILTPKPPHQALKGNNLLSLFLQLGGTLECVDGLLYFSDLRLSGLASGLGKLQSVTRAVTLTEMSSKSLRQVSSRRKCDWFS